MGRASPGPESRYPMEFSEKLQLLRKQRGMTQEELAETLFVSRAAVSKWESGRGYPNIDSLKAIAQHFSVTIDELLSGGELLTLAEEDTKQQQANLRDVVFGLLDCSTAALLFLPFFAQPTADTVHAMSLLALTGKPIWLTVAFFAEVIALTACGILTLTLQRCQQPLWMRYKGWLSTGLTAAGALLFTACRQPYAAAFLFIHLLIKGFIARKSR